MNRQNGAEEGGKLILDGLKNEMSSMRLKNLFTKPAT
jgi:hypothetical protein